MNYNFKKLAGVFLAALFICSTPVEAAKINIHLTQGGPFWSDVGVVPRHPSYIGSTPAPIVPGTTDVLDCHAIAQANPDYLKTTEAGAVCNATAQVQKHLRDNVELDIEVLVADLAPVFGPSILGLNISFGSYVTSKQSTKNDEAKAFNTIISQLKKKNARDSGSNPLTAHLPNYDQLNLILPDDPYYQNNPDFPNGKWKPPGMYISDTLFKALGVNPSFNVNPTPEDIRTYYTANSNTDFMYIITDTSLPNSTRVYDLDISDGVGLQGPYSRDVYNSIDFTNPATWPPGFNLNSPKSIVDFQGVLMHEIIHGLDFQSAIGSGYAINVPPVGLPRALEAINLLDLFRVRNSDLANAKSINDFRSIPRFWSLDVIPNRLCNFDQGTAVAVLDYNIQSGFYSAPLSNGNYAGPVIAGDGQQASHFRSPYNRVPINPANCTGTKGSYFFEDPPGRLMRPATNFHNPSLLYKDDLQALDVIGWDIDYEGKQSTVLDPYVPFNLNDNLVPLDQFQNANGLKVVRDAKFIAE